MNFIFDENISGKNLFFPAKTIFASPIFTDGKTIFPIVWQKPAKQNAHAVNLQEQKQNL